MVRLILILLRLINENCLLLAAFSLVLFDLNMHRRVELRLGSRVTALVHLRGRIEFGSVQGLKILLRVLPLMMIASFLPVRLLLVLLLLLGMILLLLLLLLMLLHLRLLGWLTKVTFPPVAERLLLLGLNGALCANLLWLLGCHRPVDRSCLSLLLTERLIILLSSVVEFS